MKKLLIMTGVAAFAFGAFAAFTNGTGFDELNTGAFVPSTYWNNPAELEASVVAYENGEALAVRPAYFTGEGDNVNFLAIESASASTPLKRFVETTEDARAIGNGLYLDTLVQFTVSTETMGASEESNAKLAIWAQTSDETPAVTNFVVQAGYITAGGVEAHNYTMTAPAGFDYTAWHRLTVKAINDIDTSANTETVGFVVFVDETALTRANSAAIGDEGYVPTLNTVAGKFATAVLPSMVSTGNTKLTLQAVAFSGNGKIDDVSFTDVAPTFAKTDIVFTLNIGEGVTGFTLNGTPYANLTAGASVTLDLAANVTVVTVANVTYAAGYRDAVLSGGNGGTIGGLVFTVTGDAPVATISAVRDMFTITVGADTFGYATLADAIADAAKGTIVMADNYTIPGSTFIDVTSDVVLDLAGKSLTGPENDALFAVAEGVSLTIVNSAVNDASLLVNYSEEDYVPAERYVVTNNGGDVIIGNKDGGFVVVNGNITEAVSANASENTIYKGKFAVASNSNGTGNACDLSPESIAEGSTLLGDPVEGYWVVDVDGEEPVTTYTVTFSYTVPGAESATESSVDVEDGTLLSTLTWPTLPEATGYTASWPAYSVDAAVTEDVTYTATYTPETYTVTFYTNSVEYATATYTFGDVSTYTAPADPVVDGFTFGGWFSDKDTFETAFVFSAGVADDTQAAYAKLTAVQPPEDEYPSYIPTGDAAAKAKYDSWATYAGVTTAAAAEELEEAYLLNCKPDEVAAAKAAFKFTSITKDGDKWVTPTTTSYNDREYNGTVTVKSYSDVECTTESETGTFFRATLQ